MKPNVYQMPEDPNDPRMTTQLKLARKVHDAVLEYREYVETLDDATRESEELEFTVELLKLAAQVRYRVGFQWPPVQPLDLLRAMEELKR